MLKKTESFSGNLTLETQEDFIVSHVVEFEAAIAENPPDEETALVLALTLHLRGKERLATAALEYVERCIEGFPKRPSDATNQIRLSLICAGYFFVANRIGRDTIITEDAALKYVRYASDNDFWDQTLLLCVASLLSEEWIFGQLAKRIVEAKVDEWITRGNHRAVAQAAIALRGQVSSKHEVALRNACKHLGSVEDLSWCLIALKKFNGRLNESRKEVAQNILGQLRTDIFMQSVLRSGSLGYILSYPQLIDTWRDSSLLQALCSQTIIRDVRVENDKLICDLREEAWEIEQPLLVPFEVALATYAIVYAGFDAIRGVRLNDAPALIDAVKQASEIEAGYLLVSPIKRQVYNLFVTLSLIFISLRVIQFSIGQDIKSPILLFLVSILNLLLAMAPVGAIIGWVVKGDALGGLWNFILEQSGQK